MSKKLLVIGAGSIGRRHMGNFYKHGIKEISCADPNPDRLEQAKQICSISNTYLDYKEALSLNRYDAVVISSPTSMHTQMAIDAANAGCHIFLEKPVAHNLNCIEDLVHIVQKNKLEVFVAYCHRFIPSVQRLKTILDSGRIGRVYAFNMNWGSYLPTWHPWEDYRSFYMAKKEQGGGALLDESHGIDLLRFLFGAIKEVQGDVGTISHLEINSDDWASMLLRMENGMRGKAHFDLIRHDPQIKLEILGEKGSITWDRIDHKITIYASEAKSYEMIPYTTADLLSMYDTETLHFINCISGKEKSLISLDDGIQTMKVIEAVFESSETGKRIKI